MSLMAVAPAEVEAISCGSFSRAFAGTVETHMGAVLGASSRIEYVNEALCTPLPGGQGSFSSYWVAVVGNHPNDTVGRNIFQIGVDKCQGSACPAGVPVNDSYYFYAYGRMASSACGNAVDPMPVMAPKGLASAGKPLYSIFRQSIPGAGIFYVAKISGSQQTMRSASSLETCWSGVDSAQLLNEVAMPGDQLGGPDDQRQNWEDPLWRNGSVWQAITRQPNSQCDVEERSSDRCRWSASGDPVWWSWDTRY